MWRDGGERNAKLMSMCKTRWWKREDVVVDKGRRERKIAPWNNECGLYSLTGIQLGLSRIRGMPLRARGHERGFSQTAFT